jgi:LemA protein
MEQFVQSEVSGCRVILFHRGGIPMTTTLMLIVAACLAGVIYVIASANRLQALNSRCDKATADIDVQLQHRHQLIPNLLELLKGYLGHEMKQLEAIAKLQMAAIAAATPQQRIEAEDILGSQIKQVMLNASQMPKLQANEHFVALRSELTDTENKIAAARRFLNLAVDEFNASLKGFPNAQMSAMHRLQPRSFFSLGLNRPAVEEAPSIKF